MSLTGKTKAGSYKDLLQKNNSNNGIDTSQRKIVDGEGTASVISMSDDSLYIQPNNDNGTNLVRTMNVAGNDIFSVDSTNMLVKAGEGQHIVNTQIKDFCITSVNSMPSSANTWTALSSIGSARFVGAVELGTGSTPDTSLTISNTAHNVAMAMWYVPLDITIDSCNVWFGADDASGDDIKFSVMSYTVATTNDALGGDLSSGVENCVSPSTITGAGYEQMYYQALTVSLANVAAGKVIMAFVHSGSTNADITANMQLIYHLR